MGRGRRKAPGALPRPVAPPPEPIIGDDAEAGLPELLDYIAKDSPRNAQLVSERIIEEIERIRQHPQSGGHPDHDAPDVPHGATGRMTTESGHTIRYVYPFQVDDRAYSLIVSIRRGIRAALDKPEYVLRWMEERAKRDL